MPLINAPTPPRSPLLRRSFVIARIAGIEVAVHATWFAIFVALVLAARFGIVPEIAPDGSAGASALLAVGFALCFYLFVLAHEFAHALVARAYGLRAGRITLFFFGGVAQIGTEARDPGQEFRIALAGPLVSLVLASVLAAVSRLLHPGNDGFPGLWGAFAAINLALALFNLVPGFPLDGGRILRSALWARMHDRARATRWAAFGGKLVAFGLMGAGAVFLATGSRRGTVPGLWGLMLGWFLYGMAGGAGAAEGGAVPSDVLASPADSDPVPEGAHQPEIEGDVAREPPGGAARGEIVSGPSEPARPNPRETALRLDRVLFGDDPPVRLERPPAKVNADEGEAPASDESGGRSRAQEGAGSPRASASESRDRSRHSR